ncbi:hypothetical protein [Ferruginibacter sp. SUN106]|uniref:hypothetical protein n=1 Tax=Ferruginibacter sp. SUN106 TaxID=2978348 RepID=UPI003D36DF2C
MKPYLHFMVCLLFITAGCNNASDTTTTNAGNGEITESTLPKGKLVVDDDDTQNTADPKSGSFNDYNAGTDSNTTKQTDNAPAPIEVLKRRYKNLLVFHADDTMKIKKAYIATLILAKDQVLATIKDEALESSNANKQDFKHDTTVDIGNKMRARLIDMSGALNKGFDIELIGGEEAATQSITEKRKKAIWNWKLTPQTPGQQELKLSINIIEKDGESVTLPTKNIPVMIFAEKESFWESVGGFFKNDSTKWIMTAILIPIFVAWITSKVKYRTENKIRDPQVKNNPPNDTAAVQPNAAPTQPGNPAPPGNA